MPFPDAAVFIVDRSEDRKVGIVIGKGYEHRVPVELALALKASGPFEGTLVQAACVLAARNVLNLASIGVDDALGMLTGIYVREFNHK